MAAQFFRACCWWLFGEGIEGNCKVEQLHFPTCDGSWSYWCSCVSFNSCPFGRHVCRWCIWGTFHELRSWPVSQRGFCGLYLDHDVDFALIIVEDGFMIKVEFFMVVGSKFMLDWLFHHQLQSTDDVFMLDQLMVTDDHFYAPKFEHHQLQLTPLAAVAVAALLMAAVPALPRPRRLESGRVMYIVWRRPRACGCPAVAVTACRTERINRLVMEWWTDGWMY